MSSHIVKDNYQNLEIKISLYNNAFSNHLNTRIQAL